MKVLCVNDDYAKYELTKGKWYEVTWEDEIYYLVSIDNLYYKPTYCKSRFKTQQEVRDEKLKELGIV